MQAVFFVFSWIIILRSELKSLLRRCFFCLGGKQPQLLEHNDWDRSPRPLSSCFWCCWWHFQVEFSAVDEWLMADYIAGSVLCWSLRYHRVVITGNTRSAPVVVNAFHCVDQISLAIQVAASLYIWECLFCVTSIQRPQQHWLQLQVTVVLFGIYSFW